MNILDYLDSFLNQLDSYIEQTESKITCQELFILQDNITNRISNYSKSKANFTGFSEMIIYQVISHHFLKELKNGEMFLEAGKTYSGKQELLKKIKREYKGTGKRKTQQPDITIEKNNEILLLLSIKKNNGQVEAKPEDVYNDTVKKLLLRSKEWEEKVIDLKVGDKIPLPLQDINRIENLYGQCGKFKAITIYYNKPTKENVKILNLIKNEYPWYDYICLQDNGEKSFIDLLDEKVNLKKILIN